MQFGETCADRQLSILYWDRKYAYTKDIVELRILCHFGGPENVEERIRESIRRPTKIYLWYVIEPCEMRLVWVAGEFCTVDTVSDISLHPMQSQATECKE